MLLEIKSLEKKYGTKTILNIPDFFIDQGIHLLKAPNGSGKTTLSKIITGLIPFSGNIRLIEKFDLVKDKYDYRMAVNYAEAEPVYPGFLTASDLIGFYSHSKKAGKEQSDSIAAEFGIEKFYNQPCGTYSSGMLKRLSLSLAFLGNPVLIVLDEPYNSLDDEAKETLNRLIMRRNQNDNISFILASHEGLDIRLDSTLTIENETLKKIEQ
jgi:ABC-2 type transport system ATP-binding protein